MIKGQTVWLRPTLPVVVGCLAIVALLICLHQPAAAITQLPTPDPIPGSFGLEATKVQDPPKVAPSISTPANGASPGDQQITVSGICQNDTLVEVHNNKVMAGSAMCKNGSFSIRISLFIGTNELTVIAYDDLGQASPLSKPIRVTFSSPRLSAFGRAVTLTSTYGRRAAAVGDSLTWPLQLSGGSGPYAFSIDWGDGSEPELKSQGAAGSLSISHRYERAGIYTVSVTVTDNNGVTAFLQVVALASGEESILAGTESADEGKERVVILWIPAALTILLLLPAYWLGRRSQLISLRRQLERDRDAYMNQSASSS